MAAEVLRQLAVKPRGTWLDATFGGGGHSERLLTQLGPEGRLIAMDCDPEAVQRARQIGDERLRPVRDRFSNMARHAEANSLDGVLFDLGLSSLQLDDESRGFSFHATGPLDMRMDPDSGPTAADWLARASTDEMQQLFRDCGGERHAAAIAAELDRVRRRSGPPQTADELAAVVCRVKPARDGRRHPATRVFLALRIAVNRELQELAAGLRAAAELLRDGGRLVVIAFHSLEDSRVVQFIRGCPQLRPVGRVLKPTAAERRRNPRARSALLRTAEKVAAGGVAA